MGKTVFTQQFLNMLLLPLAHCKNARATKRLRKMTAIKNVTRSNPPCKASEHCFHLNSPSCLPKERSLSLPPSSPSAPLTSVRPLSNSRPVKASNETRGAKTSQKVPDIGTMFCVLAERPSIYFQFSGLHVHLNNAPSYLLQACATVGPTNRNSNWRMGHGSMRMLSPWIISGVLLSVLSDLVGPTSLNLYNRITLILNL